MKHLDVKRGHGDRFDQLQKAALQHNKEVIIQHAARGREAGCRGADVERENQAVACIDGVHSAAQLGHELLLVHHSCSGRRWRGIIGDNEAGRLAHRRGGGGCVLPAAGHGSRAEKAPLGEPLGLGRRKQEVGAQGRRGRQQEEAH